MLLAYPGSLGDELNGKRQASIGISSRCAKAQCGQVMTELRMIAHCSAKLARSHPIGRPDHESGVRHTIARPRLHSAAI